MHNPPLRGNFAPVVGECTLNDLVVDGVLPPGLDGVYLRNPSHTAILPHSKIPPSIVMALQFITGAGSGGPVSQASTSAL